MRETTQGLVEGRLTSGSAVTGLEEPSCGVGGMVTTCAFAGRKEKEARSRRVRAAETREGATVGCMKTILGGNGVHDTTEQGARIGRV